MATSEPVSWPRRESFGAPAAPMLTRKFRDLAPAIYRIIEMKTVDTPRSRYSKTARIGTFVEEGRDDPFNVWLPQSFRGIQNGFILISPPSGNPMEPVQYSCLV